jgi:hypothetical protein
MIIIVTEIYNIWYQSRFSVAIEERKERDKKHAVVKNAKKKTRKEARRYEIVRIK